MGEHDNPPAFPREVYGYNNQPGMSLRDWFAGQIAAAYCTATDSAGLWQTTADEAGATTIAKMAYSVADAMLAARTQQGATP